MRILQVHKAFEYLSKSEEVDQPDVRYEVTVRRSDSQQGGLRGVMLREPLDTAKAATYMCEVQPKLHEVSLLHRFFDSLRGIAACVKFSPECMR